MKKILFLTSLLFFGLMSCQSQSSEKSNAGTEHPTPGYQDIGIAEFKAKMSEPGIVLLDVRTPEETAKGKIEGAMELDFRAENFATEVGKLDKNKTYLIYCRSGNRSGKTCKLMSEQGFTKLYNLEGGYNVWPKE